MQIQVALNTAMNVKHLTMPDLFFYRSVWS